MVEQSGWVRAVREIAVEGWAEQCREGHGRADRDNARQGSVTAYKAFIILFTKSKRLVDV